uniref:Uncharacterized protein n=1 Tax=Cacopsylla melanoneura TaxID=428564 RepID=A0A8D8VQR7_9HEMI
MQRRHNSCRRKESHVRPCDHHSLAWCVHEGYSIHGRCTHGHPVSYTDWNNIPVQVSSYSGGNFFPSLSPWSAKNGRTRRITRHPVTTGQRPHILQLRLRSLLSRDYLDGLDAFHDRLQVPRKISQ